MFAHIAVKNRLLSEEQIADALATLRRGPKKGDSLAAVLESTGVLGDRSIRKVQRAVEFRDLRLDAKLYARIALKSGLADQALVDRCLQLQKRAYKKRKTPKDIGQLLLEEGLSPDADQAIRLAMESLDRDEYIARKIQSLTDLAAITDQPKRGKGKRKSKSEGKAKRGLFGRRKKKIATAPKRRLGRGSARRAATPPPDSEPDEPAASDDAELPAGERIDSPPPSENGIDFGELEDLDGLGDLDDLEDLDGLDEAGDRAVPDLSDLDDLNDDGLASGARLEETSDNLRALMSPSDLSLGGKNQLAAPAGELRSDVDDLEDLEEQTDADAASALDETLPVAPLSDPSDTTKIAVAGDALECPKCNVALESGTAQCLYCGYSFGSSPGETGPHAPLLEEDAGTDEILAFESDGSAGSIPSLDPEAAPAASDAPAEQAEGESEPADLEFESDVEGSDASDDAESSAPAADAAPVLDRAFDDAFEDAVELWDSSRGRVVRARETETGASRLVWRLPDGLAPTDEQVSELLEDAASLQGLGLAQVLPLLWLSRTDEETYAVYEDAGGLPAPVRAGEEPVARKLAARLLKQAATILSRVHEAELLARELRPEMVLLPTDDDGDIHVFGLALMRLAEPPAEGIPSTKADTSVPPERKRKAGRAEARTDLFGLGALLVTLITGEGPTGREPKVLPDVPGAMKTFLKKTLAPATGMRYLDASKCFFDLNRCPGARGYEVELATR